MKNIPILLVDDHALFRSGIAMVLKAGLPGAEVHEAATLDEALRLDELQLQLVLLDVQLQGLSGLEGIALLKRRWPATRIVVVSAFDLNEVASEALARGAAAFIAKTERPECLLRRIEQVLEGRGEAGAGAPGDGEVSGRPRLTPRQCEVLDLLAQGLPNKSIGRRLGLSEHTVRSHVQALLLGLQVSSRSEAVFAARRLGLIR